MKRRNQTEILDQRIAQLTLQHKQELIELKEQFNEVQNQLTPSYLVQEGLNGLFKSVNLRENLIHTTLSFLGGFISKKMVIGNSENPLKKTLGNLIQFWVTGFLSKFNSQNQDEK
ncbi:hypothetical protein [Flavobacterium sp.]|uniref:hypothetical protein n=1 Tax=Flavobacterium sp. TaxID=239 RepID=UPI002FDAAA9D